MVPENDDQLEKAKGSLASATGPKARSSRSRAQVSASTLRSRSLFDKAAVAAAVDAHVLPHLESGRLRVPMQATFAMDDATAAYEHFGAGGKLGKIVLVPPGP